MKARKSKKRNKKGTVAVDDRNGMLRLRWRHQGKPYQKSLGMQDTPYNRRLAEGKAAEIQADIAFGRFDKSLDKYFLRDETIAPVEQTTVTLFEDFIAYRRQEGTSPQAIRTRYNALLSNLKRFGRPIEDTDIARAFIDLLRSRQSGRVANQNLSLMKGFGRWCLEQGLADENPYSDIKPLRDILKVQNRKPFTREEIERFLFTLRTDPTDSRYYDFCLLMLSLGLRPSEAIGLRWQHVDLERSQVTISESLARSGDGKSAGYARQRKVTKTAKVRVLPLSPKLLALLKARKNPKSKPGDLVFTTATGKAIDDHNFSQRTWRRICEKAGIEHRPPYVSRHTLLSHGIEYEGWSLPQAARVAGHTNTRMVAMTYGHMIDVPKLPEF